MMVKFPIKCAGMCKQHCFSYNYVTHGILFTSCSIHVYMYLVFTCIQNCPNCANTLSFTTLPSKYLL